MAECSFARCQQERRAIRKELQRWTKNMVYILGLERVAEELMGRRKWKLYQDGLVPRRSDGERSSDEDTLPDDGPPPAIKIKTIEEINAPEDAAKDEETDNQRPMKKESILASLIQRPATQPKLEYHEEPADWKPADRCYFCVDGEKEEAAPAGGATSPASESDSSSVSGAKSPPAPPLLQHLLQLQAQNPQAIAQFQQMMAALAALGTGLVPPALSQAWLMQRLAQARQHGDGRLPSESNDKVPVEDSSPSMTSEQPLDLSAKSSSTGSPPPVPKGLENSRPKNSADAMSARRAYSEDELAAALRDIQSGRLGTRRAAAVYGIPRSTLRNKVYKLQDRDSDPDSDPERPDAPDSPPSVILKIPTFPLPDERPASPPRAPLLLPPAAFDAPPAPLYASSLSLNDLIAKSISQKLQQPPERDAAFARPDARHVSVIKTPPDGRFPAPGNSRAPNNGQPAGGKGTRPKRGKYRNYDRDSLVEAVKAVQRGEMSVHRAGSYYGVPHSTLEYKVKERHLMRPRKREPKPPQDAKPPPPKPPPPKPGKFTNGLGGGLGAPEGFAAGYPFWAGGFAPAPAAPELYASHMMRRLREEAPPANGSFLEGIIRSSLADQRPGAALLARLADEPAARRARLADGALAADMRAAVQRLRARAASPGPPAGPPPVATPAPPAAPPDRV